MAFSILKECKFCGNQYERINSSNTVYCSFYCRFLEIAAKFNGTEACWEWPMSKNRQTGYGQFVVRIGGKSKLLTAHRVSHEIFLGFIPDGMDVCHKCDNRKCFNPAHLFVGYAADNMSDMVEKGRSGQRGPRPEGWIHPSKLRPECVRRGNNSASAKINEETAILIADSLRNSGLSMVDIAKKYCAPYSTVTTIKYGVAWGHVTGVQPSHLQRDYSK